MKPPRFLKIKINFKKIWGFKPVVVTVDRNVDFPTEGKPISATKKKKNFRKVYRSFRAFPNIRSPKILRAFPQTSFQFSQNSIPMTLFHYGSGQWGKGH